MSDQPVSSGLKLASSFPEPIFEALKNRIIAKMGVQAPELENLSGGHNGVLYRLRACEDCSKEFSELFAATGPAPPIEERYRQERLLFGFFVSGVAVLDSFSFFIYFCAAHLEPSLFPTQTPADIRSISLKSTAKMLAVAFPGELITVALTKLVSDSNFKNWETIRNVLAHRSVPGRTVFIKTTAGLATPAADWKITLPGGIKLDENLTPPRLAWLVTILTDLVDAADGFAKKYF